MDVRGRFAFSPVIAVLALVCLIAAVSLTAGCSKSEKPAAPAPAAPAGGGSITVPAPGGEKAALPGAEGLKNLAATVAEKIPSGFPTDFPLYEGATKNFTTATTAEGTSYTVTLDTPDAAQKVIDFFTKALPEKGYPLGMTMDVPNGTMMHFAKGEKTSGAVTITTDAGKTKAAVTLMMAK